MRALYLIDDSYSYRHVFVAVDLLTGSVWVSIGINLCYMRE